MASDLEFVEFLVDQIGDAGDVSYRKMFGEYAIYCNGKVVALVCDNKVFVKITEAGQKYVGNIAKAPAYKGAKDSFLIEEQVDDSVWLTELIRITEVEVPLPKPKKKKPKKK